MMAQVFILIAIVVTLAVQLHAQVTDRAAAGALPAINWNALAPLPDREGFAGAFAGVSGGALLVAGGANFPDKMPWHGGTKVWHDTVFVLEEPGAAWRVAGKLPRPLGYGVSVTTKEGVLCLGGSDATRHYADAFLLQWREGKLIHRQIPSLPVPCANMAGARVGDTVYLAGGADSPAATNALKTFWSLDLKHLRWRQLQPWPGPARMFSVAGGTDGGFYLFSGVELKPGKDGKPVRSYLRDAYRYAPASGWKRLADLPRAAAAAPSPAVLHKHHLFVISGDDGALVSFEPKSKHPGFPRDVLAYGIRADRWTSVGDSPLSRATVPVVEWRGRTVIPSGEVRPGVRSPEVWSFNFK